MNGMANGMRAVKGYITWVGKVKRKRVVVNWDSCRKISMAYVYVLGRSAYVLMIFGG
jgi:hypothetical protein